MAQTLAQITKQIEKLQKEADVLRHAELKGVVDRIKVAIAHYGLTPDQLGFGKPAVKSAKPAAKRGEKAAVPRFANDDGQVWSGRGPRPRWLREALSKGRSLEEFSTEPHKRPSTVSTHATQRKVSAVTVVPATTKVVAKRVKANTKQSEIAAQPVSSSSDAAPKGKRRTKPGVATLASKEKPSIAKAAPVTAKRAQQAKAQHATRLAAAPNKAVTGPSAEKSGLAASAPAAA